MNFAVAIVDLSNGYGGAGLTLSHHLEIPAVGFVSQTPDAALRESTVLKEHYAHDPNRFADFPLEPATLFERFWALASKALVNWNVAEEHDEIDEIIRDSIPDSLPLSGKILAMRFVSTEIG